ncbi:MAG: carbon-nitrogen hydrolase family protein [Clostridia bacterium]|nr:carbon-nitrogen hydrolase family protein [Clostridia bacterium]
MEGTMPKLALIQMLVGEDTDQNLCRARELLRTAKENGAEIAVLPEMFACPYENAAFVKNAEPFGGKTCLMLEQAAKENGMLIIGGSLPESEKGNIYNTCFVYGPDGKLLARHRKVHLFDIDIPGGQYFKESDTLTAGEDITVFDSPYGRFGIGICFDIRFAELARSMALKGANVLFYPGAFNHTTGPAHWELLLRARAVDDQLFVVGTAPANNRDASYHSYGHSMIVDPWGKIVDSLGEEEAILYAEIDFDEAKAIRERLPVMSGLRRDVYPVDPIK